jgi:hypothetical protein
VSGITLSLTCVLSRVMIRGHFMSRPMNERLYGSSGERMIVIEFKQIP